jgi:hypothetical protein
MKKQMISIGKVLSRAEQKQINGGGSLGGAGEEGCISSYNSCTLGVGNECSSGEICGTISKWEKFGKLEWESRENKCVCSGEGLLD